MAATTAVARTMLQEMPAGSQEMQTGGCPPLLSGFSAGRVEDMEKPPRCS
jgi:hypothetical protein